MSGSGKLRLRVSGSIVVNEIQGIVLNET